jgi:hypothetical protein
LRLHCIDVINRLCEATGEYAPVGMHLIQVLSSNDLIRKKVVPSTEVPPVLSALLKLKQDQIRKASCRLVLIPRTVEILRAHLKTHRASVAFPELWVSHRQGLMKTGLVEGPDGTNGKDGKGGRNSKRWKGMKGGKKQSAVEESDAWRIQASKSITSLIEEADDWSRQVKDAREGRIVNIKRPGGPSDVDGCDKFILQMKAIFEGKDAEKKLHADDTDVSAHDAFFPGSLNDSVDEILKEAAAEHAKGSKLNETDEVEVDEDGDVEVVKPLNPKEFL